MFPRVFCCCLLDLCPLFIQTCERFFSIAEEKVSDVVPSGVLGSFQSPRTPGVQSNPKMNGRVSMSFLFMMKDWF